LENEQLLIQFQFLSYNGINSLIRNKKAKLLLININNFKKWTRKMANR
jgi:c-di-AMP phosphodiesterase-like protein